MTATTRKRRLPAHRRFVQQFGKQTLSAKEIAKGNPELARKMARFIEDNQAELIRTISKAAQA